MQYDRNNPTDWRNGASLYQIYPRSFLDTSGNGIGDLAGIVQKLDYIAELGVDGVWISPFFPSPMVDNGYDVQEYCDIDPVFGDLNRFDQLVSEAHSRGLKIVIDQVYSHTSDQHEWFRQSRSSADNERADWYVWTDPKDDGSVPNNWQAWFSGSSWNWDPMRGQYYLANFHPKMPDLNLHNVDVQAAILQVTKFWLDRGVDGFRLDACNFYTHDRDLRSNPPNSSRPAPTPADMQQHIHDICQPETLHVLERIRSLCDSYASRLLIGEISSENDLQRAGEYTQTGRLHSAYSFEFLRDQFSPSHIQSAVTKLDEVNPGHFPTIAFSNHDTPRVATRWSLATRDDRRTKMINALQIVLRANVCIYQGQELGLEQVEIAYEQICDPAAFRGWPHYKGRDGCRTPMPWDAEAPGLGFSKARPWLPMGPNHAAKSVRSQIQDSNSVLAHFKEMMALRRENMALRSGDIEFKYASEDVLVFTRTWRDEVWLCVFNFSDAARPVLGLDVEIEQNPEMLAQDQIEPFGYRIVRLHPARINK